MTRLEFQDIFRRLQRGEATREEMDRFLDAVQTQAELEAYFQELLKAHFAPSETGANSFGTAKDSTALDQLLARTWETIDQQTQAPEKAQPVSASRDSGRRNNGKPARAIFKKWAAAASVLIILGLGAGLYIKNRPVAHGEKTAAPARSVKAGATIQPGKSAAVLTLAGGTRIMLDSAGHQNIHSGDQLIALNTGGKIDYRAGHPLPAKIQYNTLTTEKGNRYQLILPDGTKAWLNAESSIRFPDRFPEGQRTVSVTGEVYFEVQHDETRPFVVQVKGQTIRDIGTAFNVNAYEDEPSIKTTLIEGIIEVNNTRLKPGWQAAIRPGGAMTIDKNADLAAITSWKDNSFLFHQTDMGAILRQVARWYDVRIIYKGNFNQTFTGGISRQSSLDEILKILSFSDKIKFEVHDRNIIVHPN